MRIKLGWSPKRYFFDTHRALTPVETLRRVEAVVDKVGITGIEDITGRDKLNIPVYLAHRPGTEAGAAPVHTGKGLTGDQARVSVLMEAIERYSAEIKEEDRAKFKF